MQAQTGTRIQAPRGRVIGTVAGLFACSAGRTTSACARRGASPTAASHAVNFLGGTRATCTGVYLPSGFIFDAA